MAEVVSEGFAADTEEPHRFHEPGTRTREAMEGFQDWAAREGVYPAVAEFIELVLGNHRSKVRFNRTRMTAIREALATFALKREVWPADDGPRFDREWPARIARYLDEVSTDAWKRTDLWRPRSR